MSTKYWGFLAGFFLLLTFSNAEAQNRRRFKSNYSKRMYQHGQLSYTAGVGISSYFGDLKDDSFNLWAKPTTQLGVQYRINNNLYLRSEILWYRISGADSLNSLESAIRPRNLSFRADNFEMNAVALWQLFNKYSRSNRPILNPYAFAGIALTSNNPKAYYRGQWHALRPLQTEGVSYSSLLFAIPAGLGVTYHLDPQIDISAEIGYRFTFSDYMDDVSTIHLGQENIEDELRKALADRGPELPEISPRPAGSVRGNSSVNDIYFITGLKVTYSPGVTGPGVKRSKRMRKIFRR